MVIKKGKFGVEADIFGGDRGIILLRRLEPDERVLEIIEGYVVVSKHTAEGRTAVVIFPRESVVSTF